MNRKLLLLLTLGTLTFSSVTLAAYVEVYSMCGGMRRLTTDRLFRVLGSKVSVPAEKLKVGDLIVGDDGTPEQVMEIYLGQDDGGFEDENELDLEMPERAFGPGTEGSYPLTGWWLPK